MSKTKQHCLTIAASAALLITGCAGSDSKEKSSSHTHGVKIKSKSSAQIDWSRDSGSDGCVGQCQGVNTCKGSSACATSDNACAKQNTCRGKGWVALDSTDCAERGGRFQPFRNE